MKEKHIRSILKAVSWRVAGAIFAIVIAFVITGKIEQALSIGVVDLILKIGMYYLHERAWNRIKFGLVKENPPEYHI